MVLTSIKNFVINNIFLSLRKTVYYKHITALTYLQPEEFCAPAAVLFIVPVFLKRAAYEVGIQMKLRKIIERSRCFHCKGKENPEITMVSSDSRNIMKGGLFIAIEGYKDNGLRYIKDAVKKGARAVIVEEKAWNQVAHPAEVALCFTESARDCALYVSRAFYDYPSRFLNLIGITGTNGKTTVTYLIEALLREYGYNPGVIGTISYRYNDVSMTADNTTPDPIALQSLFSEMHGQGVSHVIMEVSSHALAMERVLPGDFDYAVFTNLSQDHLDFHNSMEEYFKAKAKLFQGLEESAGAVINVNDPYGSRLVSMTEAGVVTYGMGSGFDFSCSHHTLSINGTQFTVNETEYHTHLVGIHNIYNVLPVIALAGLLKIDEEYLKQALSKVTNIPGRFERVGGQTDFHVFVDYAHTPDALAHLLDAANTLKKGRIITVFGCGGDRDRNKRPKMGRVVEERSDIAIVTSDNPRTEDPLAIIEDIKEGLSRDNHSIIPDRRSAIYRAIELARKNDIVLIAGKGHEDYQILGDKRIHFDDREIALEALEAAGKQQ